MNYELREAARIQTPTSSASISTTSLHRYASSSFREGDNNDGGFIEFSESDLGLGLGLGRKSALGSIRGGAPSVKSKERSSGAFIASGDEDASFPEGGKEAWLVVFGSFCGFMISLGIANSIGAFQAYISTNQLKDYDDGTIGWIFSLYTFLAFFCGVYIGPIFDKHGPRWLVGGGSCCLVASMMLLGLCTEYWHFMLVFGGLAGFGTALLFTPSVAAIGHYFNERRGTASGVGQVGGAVGGILFPLMLQSLIPQIGFAWATRIIGFVFVFLSIFANTFISSRLPPVRNATAKPDFRILRDPKFAITVMAVFLLEWALFVPMTYVSSYALQRGFSTSFAYQLLPIINVGSIFGRWLPGYFADHIGRYNASMLAVCLTILSVLGIWLPAGGTQAGLIVFALLFGFGSGSNISLTPVCVGQHCRTENYGRYYATCYTIVSVGCLTGIPIAGSIIKSNGGSYWGLIVFTGACYTGALVAFTSARTMAVGWKLDKIY